MFIAERPLFKRCIAQLDPAIPAPIIAIFTISERSAIWLKRASLCLWRAQPHCSSQKFNRLCLNKCPRIYNLFSYVKGRPTKYTLYPVDNNSGRSTLRHSQEYDPNPQQDIFRAMPPQTQEIADVLATFERDLRHMDIPYYLVSGVRDNAPIDSKSVHIYSNWPRKMLDQWEEKRGFALGPIAQYGRTATGPFFWRDATKNLSKHSKHLLEIAGSFGLKEGFVVPLLNKDGRLRGGVSIAGSEFSFEGDELAAIEDLCQAVLQDLDQLINQAETHQPVLSKQERDVLQCAASGDSIQDTGRILSISVSAVKDAQTRARKKLNAKNTTHACIIATRLNII